MKKCEECTFYHPERPKKPCSGFGELQNQHGDCSLYISKGPEKSSGSAEKRGQQWT